MIFNRTETLLLRSSLFFPYLAWVAREKTTAFHSPCGEHEKQRVDNNGFHDMAGLSCWWLNKGFLT